MQSTIPIDLPADAPDLANEQRESTPAIPGYLEETYWWAYLHPKGVRIFERQWLVNLILWGNYAKLRDSALVEMDKKSASRTLQLACVYGDFTQQLAERLAPDARLDVVDVAPIQLDNLRRKIGARSNVVLDRQNAAELTFDDRSFDQAVVFFLLHELPEEVRSRTIHEVLRVIKPGGRAVFVDYHRPVRRHPHRYIMRPILKTLEPFALDLWNTEIAALISPGSAPAKIEKSTFFGGLYQKVVMTR